MAWAVTVVLVAGVAAYLAHWVRHHGLDLRVYRAGIDAWRHGHNPYLGTLTNIHLHFTYPPFALFALTPFTWAPFAVTEVVLWVLSVLALAGAVYTVCVRCGRAHGWTLLAQSIGWASLSVLIVEPMRNDLNFGQINALLLGMIVLDLLVVPRPHRGWLIGLATAIKLTPLIFVAIPLLERDWKTAGRTAGAAGAVTGVMWLMWPKASWTYWRKDVFDARRVGGVGYVSNQSLYGDLHRWPFAHGGDTVLWFGLAVATLAMGVYVARRCLIGDRRVAAMLALAFTGLLISPISWSHHWVWVALLPPALLVHPERLGRLPVRIALCALFALSVLAPYWWFAAGAGRDVLGDSLSLCAFVVMAVWCWNEYMHRDDGELRAQFGAVSLQQALLPPANRSSPNS